MFKDQKGIALLAVMVFVILMTTLVLSLLTMTGDEQKLSTLQTASTKAFYICEGGIEKAQWYLAEDPDFRTDALTELLGGGEYKITVTDFGDKVKIISIGRIDQGKFSRGQRTIEVVMTHPSLAFPYAIMTTGEGSTLTVNGGITVEGSIHSNGDILFGGLASPEAISGQITYAGTVNFGGDNVQQTGLEEFPVIDFEYFKDMAISGGQYYSGDRIFDGDLTLQGIHFVEGNVNITANLLFDNAAIFSMGRISVMALGNINLANGITSPLALIAKGDITVDGPVYGSGICLSESDITIDNNFDVAGTVIADNLAISGGGAFVRMVYNIEPAISENWEPISWKEL